MTNDISSIVFVKILKIWKIGVRSSLYESKPLKYHFSQIHRWSKWIFLFLFINQMWIEYFKCTHYVYRYEIYRNYGFIWKILTTLWKSDSRTHNKLINYYRRLVICSHSLALFSFCDARQATYSILTLFHTQ